MWAQKVKSGTGKPSKASRALSRYPRCLLQGERAKAVAQTDRRRDHMATNRTYQIEIGMAPRAGFEPATNRLTAGCSTTELPGNRAKRCAREPQPITKPPPLGKQEMHTRSCASGSHEILTKSDDWLLIGVAGANVIAFFDKLRARTDRQNVSFGSDTLTQSNRMTR